MPVVVLRNSSTSSSTRIFINSTPLCLSCVAHAASALSHMAAQALRHWQAVLALLDRSLQASTHGHELQDCLSSMSALLKAWIHQPAPPRAVCKKLLQQQVRQGAVGCGWQLLLLLLLLPCMVVTIAHRRLNSHFVITTRQISKCPGLMRNRGRGRG